MAMRANTLSFVLVAALLVSVSAFGVVGPQATTISIGRHSRYAADSTSSHFVPPLTRLQGYLDDLSKELRAPDNNPDLIAECRDRNMLDQSKVDRGGVGDWSGFVDFNEFDGGDGQMGVAGDGKKGLEKAWAGQAELAKSKSMSAKNAWGRSTGYAESLIEQGMETTRAQQLENWQNQREVVQAKNEQRWMTEQFDKPGSTDEDWRKLSTFGVERTQKFDLDGAFGSVIPGNKLEGVIELSSRINRAETFEFKIKNPFMGFSDFRARFTADTNPNEWSISPTEGSLNGRGAPTDFLVKYRPQSPGASAGYLVVETEDDKWTWRVLGMGSM